MYLYWRRAFSSNFFLCRAGRVISLSPAQSPLGRDSRLARISRAHRRRKLGSHALVLPGRAPACLLGEPPSVKAKQTIAAYIYIYVYVVLENTHKISGPFALVLFDLGSFISEYPFPFIRRRIHVSILIKVSPFKRLRP